MLNILVAGASRGIGLGLVRVYLERGARVFAVARNPAASTGLTELAAQHGERLRVVTCDLTTPTAADEIVTALDGARLDRAIFNAGIFGPEAQDVTTASEAEIGRLFFTNAVTPLRLSRALSAQLAQGAVLGVMSSEMGSLELAMGAERPLYAASKSALNGLLVNWAAQLGEARDFTLLALHPGWVQTDMGGGEAPLTVEQSVPGLVAVIEASAGTRDFRYVDYKGETLPW